MGKLIRKIYKGQNGLDTSKTAPYFNPITGEQFWEIPERWTKVTNLNQLTAKAQDEYRSNHPIELNNIDIYLTSGKGARNTTLGSYYDRMSDKTENNFINSVNRTYEDAQVSEATAFEKPLNYLSPGQYFDVLIKSAKGKQSLWDGFKGIYDGNSGWVSDEFATKYPRLSTMFNVFGDAFVLETPRVLNTGIRYVNGKPDLVAKMRHPTYMKYYHGTSSEFPISEAKMGSASNSGLHVSDTPTIAEAMKTRGNGTNPHVKEFWGPKPSTESIDTWANGIEQLSTDYVLEPRTEWMYYNAPGDNTHLFNLIREQGVEPIYTEKLSNTGYPGFQIDKQVTLNLRESNFPKIPKSEYSRIDALIKEARDLTKGVIDISRSSRRARMEEINAEAAKIMSDYGYKSVKYNNLNSAEGGGGISYYLTDPSILYEHTPFNTISPIEELENIITTMRNNENK